MGYRSFFWRVDPPKPFHTWSFDKGLSGWTNDANNWNLKWIVEPPQPLCLYGRPAPQTVNEEAAPWLIEEEPEVQLPIQSAIQAKLWSPKILARIGMRCLTIKYRISLGDNDDGTHGGASLSLLQRQEGCLFYLIIVYFCCPNYRVLT